MGFPRPGLLGGQVLAHLLGRLVGHGVGLVSGGGPALGFGPLRLGGGGPLLGCGSRRLHLGLGCGGIAVESEADFLKRLSRIRAEAEAKHAAITPDEAGELRAMGLM